MAVPPHTVMKPLLRFCRTVVAQTSPTFIPVQTVSGAEQSECFENVRTHIEKHGGEAVHGWAIWEWPKVYFEAEFHCVWKSGEGKLIDITPNDPPYPWILFLPDPTRIYQNKLIDNKRKALVRDSVLDRFYEVCSRWHKVKRLQFEPGFVETDEWNDSIRKLIRERVNLDQEMLQRFGHTLLPVISHRITSPMPNNK